MAYEKLKKLLESTDGEAKMHLKKAGQNLIKLDLQLAKVRNMTDDVKHHLDEAENLMSAKENGTDYSYVVAANGMADKIADDISDAKNNLIRTAQNLKKVK